MKKNFYTFSSFLCVISLFFMIKGFQRMAYWGDDLTWYWVGVIFTYIICLVGIVFVFLLKINIRELKTEGKLIFGLPIIGIALLVLLLYGLLWTSFVIIAGWI